MRAPRPITLLLVALGLAWLGGLLAWTALPYRLAGGATTFAPGYSEFAFQMLSPGQTRAEVERALGAPLASTRLAPVETWFYAASAWFGAPKRLGMPAPPASARSFDAPTTNIHFGPDGRARLALGDYLRPPPRPGATHQQVLAIYGLPIFRVERPAAEVDDYSQPAGSPVWKLRRVYYDAEGRVLARHGATRLPEPSLPRLTHPFPLEPSS